MLPRLLRLHFCRRELSFNERFNPKAGFCIFLPMHTCHLGSPSCLNEWRVTRSFKRHDSITISVTRENSSPPLFLSFYARSLFHVKPRARSITLARSAPRFAFFTIKQESKPLSLLTLNSWWFSLTQINRDLLFGTFIGGRVLSIKLTLIKLTFSSL